MQSTFKPTQGLLMPFCSPNRILTQEPLTQSTAAEGTPNPQPNPQPGQEQESRSRAHGEVNEWQEVQCFSSPWAKGSEQLCNWFLKTGVLAGRFCSCTLLARAVRTDLLAPAATSAWGHCLRAAGTRACTPGVLIKHRVWCWKEQYPETVLTGSYICIQQGPDLRRKALHRYLREIIKLLHRNHHRYYHRLPMEEYTLALKTIFISQLKILTAFALYS